MGTEIFSGPLGDIRLAGASKGVALSTTAAFTGFPEGTHWVSLTPRNFATAVVARLMFCPFLAIFKTTDLLVAAANFTDYTSEAQDGDTATSVALSALDTIANGDALYVGSYVPFRGVNIDVDGANAIASVLTVKYWNGTAWTDITATDGTASGGATMAVDGSVTWTVPTAWVGNSLVAIGDVASAHSRFLGEVMFWTRWEVSAALTNPTTLDHMLGINRSTAYSEWLPGQAIETTVDMGMGGYAGVEALSDAGTGNLLVNCAVRAATRRFK